MDSINLKFKKYLLWLYLQIAFWKLNLFLLFFKFYTSQSIFTPTFGLVCVLFLLGILIYANFFSADASQTP